MIESGVILNLVLSYRYLILFPLACVEGPFLSLVTGFLVHLGYFQFTPAFLIMIFGDIIPDSIYFYIGRRGNEKKLVEKYSSSLRGVAMSFSVLEKLWTDHPRKTMFFSKLAYGLSIPFLISAGLVKMSFKNFISYTIPATLFQYGVLMFVGYYLGKSYNLASKYVEYGYLLVAVLFIIFIAGYFVLSQYSLREIKKFKQEEDEKV